MSVENELRQNTQIDECDYDICVDIFAADFLMKISTKLFAVIINWSHHWNDPVLRGAFSIVLMKFESSGITRRLNKTFYFSWYPINNFISSQFLIYREGNITFWMPVKFPVFISSASDFDWKFMKFHQVRWHYCVNYKWFVVASGLTKLLKVDCNLLQTVCDK